MAKAKKKGRKGKANGWEDVWFWQDADLLVLTTCRSDRASCTEAAHSVYAACGMKLTGKPVRVQITEAKGAKRGK